MNNSHSISCFKIWRTTRRLLHAKWIFAFVPVVLSIGVSIALYASFKSFVHLFQSIAFFHGMMAAYLFSTVFSREGYPILPRGRHHGFIFSIIECAVGVIQLSFVFMFIEWTLGPNKPELSQCLSFVVYWWVAWLIWVGSKRISAFVIFAFPVFVLCSNTLDFELSFNSVLLLFGVATAASYHLSIKTQNGWQGVNWFNLRSSRENKSKSRFGEFITLGPKILNVANFPNIRTVPYFVSMLLVEMLILVLSATIMLMVLSVLDFIRVSSTKAFDQDHLMLAYFYCILMRFPLKHLTVNVLENGLPSMMSLSRESWQKARLKMKHLDRVAMLIALVVSPLIIDLAVSYMLSGTLTISMQYWRALVIFAVTIPIFSTFTMILAVEKNQKLFSQNRKNVFQSSRNQSSLLQKLCVLGGVIGFVVIALSIGLGIAMSGVKLEWFQTPEFFIPALIIYLLYIVTTYLFENKLECRAFAKGDLV